MPVPVPAISCVLHLLREGFPDGPTDGRTFGRTNPLIETHLKKGCKAKNKVKDQFAEGRQADIRDEALSAGTASIAP